MKQILGLAAWIVLTFVAAAIAGLASINAGLFYRQLTLPEWAPPASVFGPVWTVLYLLWISFAVVLNFSVWRLNPQSLG